MHRRHETSGVHVIPRMQHEVTEASAVKGGAFLSALLQPLGTDDDGAQIVDRHADT